MTPSRLILLPGLDGTGDLFAPLLSVIPRSVSARVIAYPCERRLSYDELFGLLENLLAAENEMILLAESFSGPLALRYASVNPERVRGVILCGSFIRSPVPRWLGIFVRPVVFHLPLPAFFILRLLVGPGASDELVRAVRRAIQKVRPCILAWRMKDVFEVDCADALRRCAVPILYLAAARDALVRRSSVEGILAIRSDVEIRTIDAPHLLLQREPAAAWKKISQFLLKNGFHLSDCEMK